MSHAAVIALSILALLFQPKGNEDIPNGKSEPFVGRWQVEFPTGELQVNTDASDNPAVVTCAMPVKIESLNPAKIAYVAPDGSQTNFELMAFGGRTSLLPQTGTTSIAVWIDEDHFDLYSVNEMGRADWDHPKEYRRCP